MEKILVLFIITLGILIYFYKDKFFTILKQEENILPFKRREFFLNTPERQFFEGLQKIIPIEYIVFPQIVLSSIIQASVDKKNFWTYQNKINRKTIDFVIFEKQYLKPIIAIEYDGKTHNRSDRQERDVFVDNVLKSAGIKSIHIIHQKNINFEELKNTIKETLNTTSW